AFQHSPLVGADSASVLVWHDQRAESLAEQYAALDGFLCVAPVQADQRSPRHVSDLERVAELGRLDPHTVVHSGRDRAHAGLVVAPVVFASGPVRDALAAIV